MELQAPVQQVPEAQKSSKKWLIPVSLAAAVVAGAFLYAYLTPAQNNENTSGEEQQAKAGKTVVVYTKLPPANATATSTQILVANMDGSEKRQLFSTGEGFAGFVSPKTGEYVYVINERDSVESPFGYYCSFKNYKIVARSLRDSKERVLAQGPGFVFTLRLSTDEERMAVVQTTPRWCAEDSDIQYGDMEEVLLTLSLENPEDTTTAPLPDTFYTGHDIGFYDGTKVLITNYGENYPNYIWGVFTVEGSKVISQFVEPPRPYQYLFGGDVVSTDGELVVVHEDDKDREPEDRGNHYVYPTKLVVRSTKDGTVVSTNLSGAYKFIYFERWIKDTRAYTYYWEEPEKGGDIQGDFTPTFHGYDTADEVVVNMKRYGVFEVDTGQKYEFMTRREMNEWIAEHYPQEPRLEIVHVGRIKTYIIPNEPNIYQAGQTKYLQEIISSRSYINDVLIEESPINLLGFSEI